MIERRHVALPIRIGATFETQSGLQLNAPRIYGMLAAPARARVAAILIHPSSSMMSHYLIEPLNARGLAVLALNTRYAGGDQTLIMENAIQDLGAGVRYLREQGFERVVLLGNSGGASLTALYQAQAERITLTHTPAGDPVHLVAEEMPPADGLILLAGHPGRSTLMTTYIDAAVIDERNPDVGDPALDIFAPANPAPFSSDFVARVRAAQRARSERITSWAVERLHILRERPGGARDEAFVVHRTYADPRFVDRGLDPNDRAPGGNRGDTPQQANLSANNLARFTTLTSWLSQWSHLSNADGPDNLAKTSIPVLQLEYTADAGIFPSDVARWSAAGGDRVENHRIVGASHYLYRLPRQLAEVAELAAQWSKIR
ncbi:alpha/beta hydrolase [Sphingomonas sp. CL5.1]|uniref:alpha/beta hydrolase family protein n=1 Tax=Sphingomonas sp. CL5.1 TaxID=2653203 RepID=UPI001581F3DA|nr:alpha/beta hydrolase [Sphingomonas sp. CL5.1]QKS00275.1 alpha/beta hydrolase [Sphingomonas sp. CL5.1]